MLDLEEEFMDLFCRASITAGAENSRVEEFWMAAVQL